jgi:DedD protein
MLRGDPEEEFEATAPRQDTELTLGPAMLLGLLCGLVLLCGLCFGVGYTLGRLNAAPTSAAGTESSTGQALSAQVGAPLSKPPAKGTVPAGTAPQVQVLETQQPAATDGAAGVNPTAAASPLTSNAPLVTTSPGTNASPAVVKPALPAIAAAQPLKTQSNVQPAPGVGTMVQIAAVSHSEDADVLMNALRKRGYTVAARHIPGDNLIHVQIGPFANRSDANAMSQKLLNDGYNAVVMP